MDTSEAPDYEIRENVLYVKGLSHDFAEKTIRNLFSSYGNVTQLIFRQNEGHRPVAFVHYDTVSAADNCIKALNNVTIKQSILNISKAKRNLNRFRSKTNEFEKRHNNPKQSIEKINNYMTQMCLTNSLNHSEEVEEVSKPYVSEVTIEALTEDLLAEIFDNLSLKQKFGIQRVCQLWRSIIKYSVSFEPTLTFGHKTGYNCSDWTHNSDDYNDMTAAIIQPDGRHVFKEVQQLIQIVRPMESIECLHFANCSIHTIALKWIISQCPNLKCLRFDNIEGIHRLEWHKFNKPLSTKLIHFSFVGNKLNDWKSLLAMVSTFTQLEELIIGDCVQDLVPVFQKISQSLTKLSVIGCDRLNANAIYALNRRNGPDIRFIEIDFTRNENCLSTIEGIYQIFNELNYFRAINIQKEEISELIHDFGANSLSVVFNDFVNVCHSVVTQAVNRGLKSLQITGSLRPTDLENFSQRFPDCKTLRLIDCNIFCVCPLGQNQPNDKYFSCRQCLDAIERYLFIESTLTYVSFNGDEYDRTDDDVNDQ